MKRTPRWGNCLFISVLEFAHHPLSTRIYRFVDENKNSHFFWKNKDGFFSFNPLHKLPETKCARYWYRGVTRQKLGFASIKEILEMRISLEKIEMSLRQIEKASAGT